MPVPRIGQERQAASQGTRGANSSGKHLWSLDYLTIETCRLGLVREITRLALRC